MIIVAIEGERVTVCAIPADTVFLPLAPPPRLGEGKARVRAELLAIKYLKSLLTRGATKLQRLRHRHAVINGRKVPRGKGKKKKKKKRSPRRSLFRYHEHARSLGNFRQVSPEVLRGGATFLILREDRIVLVAAPPRKIENRR